MLKLRGSMSLIVLRCDGALNKMDYRRGKSYENWECSVSHARQFWEGLTCVRRLFQSDFAWRNGPRGCWQRRPKINLVCDDKHFYENGRTRSLSWSPYQRGCTANLIHSKFKRWYFPLFMFYFPPLGRKERQWTEAQIYASKSSWTFVYRT